MPRASGPLAAALAERVVLLDGGLSNQLTAQGCDLSGGLWTGRVLAERPDQVEAAHTAYARAWLPKCSSPRATRSGTGRRRPAYCCAAASRRPAARPGPRTTRSGWPPRWARTGRCSRTAPSTAAGTASAWRSWPPSTGPASRRCWRRGPTCWPWRPSRTPPRPRPCSACSRGRAHPPGSATPWPHGRTRAYQPLAEAFALAADTPEVIALGVNCCDPQDVGPALEAAASVTRKPLLAYPNDGSVWDAATGQWHSPPTPPPWDLPAWRTTGARLLGGCCRIDPAAIEALAARLRAG